MKYIIKIGRMAKLLRADVTVFDISEANRKYAVETAEAASVKIGYEV